jgi:hypothetical protein|tara:strand:- start:269 stop:568 length:300 start_codon:yes stop_codon:yes gene_type:complete
MSNVRKKSKELDHHLKHEIKKIPDILNNFLEGKEKKIVYYTGQFQKDVLDNFTPKQSEKIFDGVQKFSDNVIFVQKRLQSFTCAEGDTWSGYDYIAVRR